MKKGTLIILIGPMGSGKSTLMKHVIANHPEIKVPYSYTTRPRRSDHVENNHYRFISVEEFKQKIDEGAFLEWAEFSGNYYGTLKADIVEAIKNGEVLLKEMEVQGARQVRELLAADELVTVFVDAGGWDELQRRAANREAMDPEHLEMRRIRFEDEMTFKPEADVVIDNSGHDSEPAKQQFSSLIESLVNA
jgi:guanylate kinase